ncbi:MAG: bile acid:sodium symporter family protein [Thermodesulfobacteriota bacterium]|jgi:BASS family bile acid:Na+ symporter
MGSKKLKYLSNACLVLGFFIPFVTSKFVGMPLGEMPIVSAANIVLWIVGLLLGYFAYIDIKKPPPTLPLPVNISNYIASDPSLFLMIGVLFGYLFYPSVEKSIVPNLGPYLLMLIMFSMGLAINFQDWKRMAQRPKVVGIGVLMRWLCMPLVAFLLSLVLIQLFPGPTGKTLAVGLIILGTTPTGGGSNALTMISRGDLALSVSVTSINTIIAPFIQPILILWLAGSITNLNASAIFQDLLRMVVVPVVAGSILGSIFPKFVSKIKFSLGSISVICLTFIIMGTMSKGTSTLIKQLYILLYLVVVCVLQAMSGLLLGYFLPKLFGFTYKQRKALCFEVGVENAAMAMLVAVRHFSPLTALPSIVYGKIQYIITSTIFVPRFQRIEDEEVTKTTSAERVGT